MSKRIEPMFGLNEEETEGAFIFIGYGLGIFLFLCLMGFLWLINNI